MTSLDKRNPYVILGLPFGASESDARTGFSVKKRQLRSEPDGPFSVEDLTWALHQIEQIILHPELALKTYRIPASEREAPVGVFNPPAHRIERQTDPAPPDSWDRLRREVVAKALKRALATALSNQSTPIPYE